MGIERRLNQLENEINAERVEIELENGESFWADDQDLLTGYVEAVEWMVGNMSKDEVSEKTLKFLKAKENQPKPCHLIRETLKNARDGTGIKYPEDGQNEDS